MKKNNEEVTKDNREINKEMIEALERINDLSNYIRASNSLDNDDKPEGHDTAMLLLHNQIEISNKKLIKILEQTTCVFNDKH